jgi:ribosomal protein S13
VNIGELFITLGVKGQGLGTLKEVSKAIADLPLDAVAAIAGMAGISFELSKMAELAMKTVVGFQMFTSETGLSWQELQKWQIVAEQANVSTESVASSISTLQRNLAEIRLGRGNIAPFQMLVINRRQDAFGVIEQLRQKIKGINPATATNLISQMGLSPDMMRVLQLTDRQFTEFANHVHGLNERQYKDFLQAKESLVQWEQTFRYFMFGIIAHFTEAIEKGLQFKQLLVGLGIIAGVIAVQFFPVTAAIAALILVLDDMAVYATGGKSLTGAGVKGLNKFLADLTGNKDFSIIEKIENLATAILHLGDALLAFKHASDWAGQALHDDLFAGGLSGLIQAIRGGTRPEYRNMDSVVNVHVNNQGPLDMEGWNNIGHMVKRSVQDAHLQLNN